MDPVLAAKKLIDSLVNEELDVLSEDKHEQEETKEEEHEEHEEGGYEQGGEQGNQAAQNRASVASKPAAFGKAAPGQLVQSAHGQTSVDAHGGQTKLDTMNYQDNSAQNRASISMKPSFATSGASAMSEEQVRKDILSIFGSEDLSEEFVSKAGSIYEAAVMAKAEEVIKEIHEQYETAFTQEVEDVKQELTEKVDSYLNYVVDEWMNENKLAVESGIRTEIAENFIGKLKDLFVESYIEVPQNKTNLFDEMAQTIEELEGRVNEELARNVELVNENKAVRAVGIFTEETKNLTDVQVDKISKLAENLEFQSEDDFRDKIQTLVENIKRSGSSITENAKNTVKQDNNKYLVEETVIEEDSSEDNNINDPYIKLYSDILSRTLQN
jgi:hypothetical protein